MATICAAPIKGTHLRIVKLDNCGVPVTGAGSMVVVTKGFVQVVMDPQYEDGEEFFERTADGSLCVNEKDDPLLKRVNLTVDFCEVNPSATAMVIGGRTFEDGSSNETGFTLKEGQSLQHFSLEVWQKVAGSGACDPSGVQRYIYNLWAHVGGVQVGQYTIENGRSNLQFAGETRAPSTLWGDGPTGGPWIPSDIEDDEHWAWNISTTAPPTPGCNVITI
jgi:hypothetical protein